MHVVRQAVIWASCWRSDVCAVHYEELATCSVLLLHWVSAYSDQDVYSKFVFRDICINSFQETRIEWPPNPSLQSVTHFITVPKLLFMVLRHIIYGSLYTASSDLTKENSCLTANIFWQLIGDWARLRSRFSDLLWAGWSRDRILVGARFSALVRPDLGPTQPTVQWVLGLSWG
jgi:hypothetical protein